MMAIVKRVLSLKSIHNRIVWSKKKVLFIALSTCLCLSLVWLLFPLWKLSGLMYGEIMHYRWKEHQGMQTSSKTLVRIQDAKWVSNEQISPYFIYALISAEDSRFFQHSGIDWREIRSSIQMNLAKRSYVRGASTITQQLVKQVTLTADKKLIRKLREIIGSLFIEQLLTKNEILSWYVNLVHFGTGIYGIGDAARYYFKTTPEHLSIAESIHLALVLPVPSSRAPGLRYQSLTERGKKRFLNLLKEMYNNRYITEKQYQNVKHTGDFGRSLTLVYLRDFHLLPR